MAQSQHTSMEPADGRSTVSRVFGVAFRRDTYANLAYLLARFPLGIVYFTVFVTGLSLGVGLIPVVVGIPVLAGVLALAGYVGVVEAALLRWFYDDAAVYEVSSPSNQSVTSYLKATVTNPRNYLFVLFGFGSFVAGISSFVAITVVFTLGLSLAAAPLFYWVPGFEYELTQATGTVDIGPMVVDASSFGGVGIDALPEALVASLVGVVVCLAGFHAANLTARVFRRLTEQMLGLTRE